MDSNQVLPIAQAERVHGQAILGLNKSWAYPVVLVWNSFDNAWVWTNGKLEPTHFARLPSLK